MYLCVGVQATMVSAPLFFLAVAAAGRPSAPRLLVRLHSVDLPWRPGPIAAALSLHPSGGSGRTKASDAPSSVENVGHSVVVGWRVARLPASPGDDRLVVVLRGATGDEASGPIARGAVAAARRGRVGGRGGVHARV